MVKQKRFAIWLCLIMLAAFFLVKPDISSPAAAAPEPVRKNGVVAAPVLYNGLSYDYFERFDDICFDNIYNYILADNRVFIYSGSSYVAETEELISAVSVAVFDRLLLVTCTDGAGGYKISFFDTRNPQGELAEVFELTASDMGVDSLSYITRQPPTNSSALFIVAAKSGTNSLFTVFKISETPNINFHIDLTDISYYIELQTSKSISSISKITAVCYGDYGVYNGVYYSVEGTQGLFHINLASNDITAIGLSGNETSPISDIAFLSSGGDNFLVYSMANFSANYRIMSDSGNPKQLFSGADVKTEKLYALGNVLSVSDPAAKSVAKFSMPDILHIEDIILSVGSKAGYLNSPEDIYTRNGIVAAADKMNRRVQLYDKSGITTVTANISEPQRVLFDSNSNLYVFDQSSIKYFKSGAGGYTNGETLASSLNTFKDFAISNDDTLYYIKDSKVYQKKRNTTAFSEILQSFANPSRIAVPVLKDAIYVLCGTEIVRYDGAAKTPMSIGNIGASDLAIDDAGNIYVLSLTGKIYKFVEENDQLQNTMIIESYSNLRNMFPIKAVSIIISDVSDGTVNRGDILLCDSASSVIRSIDSSVLDVKFFDESDPAFAAPVDASDSAPLSQPVMAAVLNRNTYLYGSPTGTGALLVCGSGTPVVLLKRDIPGNDFFAYIAYVSNSTAATVYGYVNKSALSANLAFSEPRYDKGRILNSTVSVFKYPSTGSVKLSDDNGDEILLQKDEQIEVTSFVKDYADGRGTVWLQIKLNEDGTKIGYISAANAVKKDYSPIYVKPKNNAEVKSDNIVGALTYRLGTYELLDEVIGNGKRVKVVGSFHPNDEYTHVQYYDEELGILDCYIKTDDLRYEGVTSLEIATVTMVMISVASAIAAAIFVIRKRNRKKS